MSSNEPSVTAEEIGLEGVVTITPARYGDERGFFSEVYNRDDLASIGIHDEFVQDNHSWSGPAGTIRGLHFQIDPKPIAKLLRVARGSIFDVVVDLRGDSPTYGEWRSVVLSAEVWNQIYVPIGFAHGFCTLEPDTDVIYKVTDHWDPEVDRGIRWDDPTLGIDWPIDPDEATISAKDRQWPLLAEVEPPF